jgi:hypothetical protein
LNNSFVENQLKQTFLKQQDNISQKRSFPADRLAWVGGSLFASLPVDEVSPRVIFSFIFVFVSWQVNNSRFVPYKDALLHSAMTIASEASEDKRLMAPDWMAIDSASRKFFSPAPQM